MRLRSLAIAATVAVLPATAALAEPQVLALLATADAKPLTCVGGECAAEFTSFCMEKPRSSPTHNTAYSLVEGAGNISVVAETTTGEPLSLPANTLRFASKRGYAAVRISVDAAELQRIGAVRVAVHVGPGVVLRPVPLARYRNPHEPDEIAAAIGINRALGERLVDDAGTPRQAAHLLSKLINALPERERVTDAHRRDLWSDTITAADAAAAGGAAVGRAKEGYEQCLGSIPWDSLADCLGRVHDKQIWPLNQKFWRRAVGS